jgi:hypothetical protein
MRSKLSRRMKFVTGSSIDLVAALLLSVCLLTSCEDLDTSSSGSSQEGPVRWNVQKAEIEGVYYFLSRAGGDMPSFVMGSNKTDGWVTFFYYWAQNPGTLNLNDLVQSGALQRYVQAAPLHEVQINLFPTNGYYWVWVRSGRLKIENNALVPE